MAVLIASDLAKDMAGVPLLRGVSFRLERRDRLTLSGRNRLNVQGCLLSIICKSQTWTRVG